MGTDAPLAPPDEVDQLAVEVVFQVPEPPTQNLSAILFLPVVYGSASVCIQLSMAWTTDSPAIFN